jgi:hypothetical protein
LREGRAYCTCPYRCHCALHVIATLFLRHDLLLRSVKLNLIEVPTLVIALVIALVI